jgi:hypothetical protein
MTEVVWVALISSGCAIVVALLTQLLATRAASKLADRTDRREEKQWQRTEASRREDMARSDQEAALAWQRAEALRKQALFNERLRQLWGFVVDVRWQVHDALERMPKQGQPAAAQHPAVSAARLPTVAAGQAYAVALLWLTALRPAARAFYKATNDLELAMLERDGGQQALRAASVWNDSYKALEDAVTTLADQWLDAARDPVTICNPK